MPYAQPNYPPQNNSYGRFNTSLPMTHEASYENRDAFPAFHYQRIASGQESGRSSPCATGPILSASQTLYEGDNIMSVIIFKLAINELLFFQF